MIRKINTPFLLGCLLALLPVIFLTGCRDSTDAALLDTKALAKEYFQEDASWYVENIPFFECSDKQLEQVYYYRWKLYKAHIRKVGTNEFVITEFINHVAWDREPFCTINAASMHHIYEGRWLRDKRYLDGYINYLYRQGGNNRQYSESIADAAYARYLVTGDSAFVLSHLDSMKASYEGWYDHWDSTKNLYYIPAMPDATEYTIASIDASGGTAGFDGGEAFRPTINSYMYGNALAIDNLAAMKGDAATAATYRERAASLKKNVETYLWNDSLQHFLDRFQQNNQYVTYWDFIRGRELAGLAPWYFNLPADRHDFNLAWKHAIDTAQLLGKYGFRTNEPSYEYYFKQFVYFDGKRGSQWNGPSWPYQSSMMLTGMANFLNNYKQDVLTSSDYLHALRLFAQQHYLPDGKINLVENYDPNLGGPIVHYNWSNHYLHSTFNNLVISGLCGIRPSKGNTLTINPLIDDSIAYFCLKDIAYRGHTITVVYDKEGEKYKVGKGLTVFVDGKKARVREEEGRHLVDVGAPVITATTKQPENFALNITRKGYPIVSASVNAKPDSLYKAVDGRTWYFPEISNWWSTAGSASATDWIALDFGEERPLSGIKIYLQADGTNFHLPERVTLEYQSGNQWVPLALKEPFVPAGNTVSTVSFEKVQASGLRLTFAHSSGHVALSEVECY